MTAPAHDAALPAARPLPPPSTPAKPSFAKQAGGMLLGMVIGGVFGFTLTHFVDLDLAAEDKALLWARYGVALFPLAIALILVAGWLAIALHEVGHLVGGFAARFRFHFFVAGLLRIDRDERERLRVGINRDLPVFGGVAAMLPTTTDRLPRRLGYLIAGGPAASLLVAVLAMLASRLPGLAPDLMIALTALGIISGLAFLVAMVPMRTGGFVTDGGRLLRLVRGGEPAQREAATLSLVGLFSAAVPPREWPAALVERALEPRDGSLEECYGASLAFYRALDLGDVEEASAHLDRMVELVGTYPPGLAPSIWVEAAYFEAAHRGRAEVAREHLALVPAKTIAVKAYERARAEAALAFAERDFAKALDMARAALPGLPPVAVFTKSRLEELVRRAEAEVAARAEAVGV